MGRRVDSLIYPLRHGNEAESGRIAVYQILQTLLSLEPWMQVEH